MKKLALVLSLLLVFSSEAYAEPYLFVCHDSVASLKNGRSDYFRARFLRIILHVEDDEKSADEEYMNLEGALTVKSGETTEIFPLMPNMKPGQKYLLYTLADDFASEAGDILSGASVSWNFPKKPELDGSAKIPVFRTTPEQMISFVPYVELVRTEEGVTGVNWRVVKIPDTSKAVTLSHPLKFRITHSFSRDGKDFYTGKFSETINIPAGETPEGTINFSEPVEESLISGINARLYSYEAPEVSVYDWFFMTEGRH